MAFLNPTPLSPERPWTFGPAGTIRYLCPIGCPWHYDEPPATRWVLRTLDPDAISDAITAAAQHRAAETEAALREHLTEHTAAVILSEDSET
ncbi:hypothetical protein [Actinoallomurus sp. NPDC052274]|uniref:hypothetical protein n=1 Tax=Actinoallomurus sp. NPDC052274 TaxID=3155420 RepID=UPI003447761D